MAMRASNGPVDDALEADGREFRSAVELPSRSPAVPPLLEEEDWT